MERREYTLSDLRRAITLVTVGLRVLRDVSTIENAPDSTSAIQDMLRAMYRKFLTVGKERHRRKSDRGTSTLAGIALGRGVLSHEPGFPPEIVLRVPCAVVLGLDE